MSLMPRNSYCFSIAICLYFISNIAFATKIYVAPGMNSYHFSRDAGYNNENWGLGFQYDPNNAYSANWGRFINSENDWSNYFTGTWYLLMYKKMRVGILAGAFDGYKKEKNGGWFLAGMPIINYRQGQWGVNIAAVPSYKNRINGALIIQFLYAIRD